MNINKELINYINKFILPEYEKNDEGHNINHINYVINRSLKFASTMENINFDMVYTIASYHDIGHHIDAKNHEKVSAEILRNDINLSNFFDEEQIQIMAQAVADHRASSEHEPNSIYGKIVSSADRNTSIDTVLRRTYTYRVKHNPDYSLATIMEESRQHIINKFGKNGYATEKMYFKDKEYEEYLKNISVLALDKEEFGKQYLKINNCDNAELKDKHYSLNKN